MQKTSVGGRVKCQKVQKKSVARWRGLNLRLQICRPVHIHWTMAGSDILLTRNHIHTER